MLQPLSGSKITKIHNPSAVSSPKRTPKNKQKIYMEQTYLYQKLKERKHQHEKNPSTEAKPGGKNRMMNTASKSALFLKKKKGYRFRAPRKHMQKRNLYRMGRARLSLFFFWKIDPPPIAECNLRAPFCTCGVDV